MAETPEQFVKRVRRQIRLRGNRSGPESFESIVYTPPGPNAKPKSLKQLILEKRRREKRRRKSD